VKFRGSREPVLYLSDPAGVEREMKRDMLDDLAKLNSQKLHDFGDPEIAARIAQYEMSFRMQTSVPELADFSNEPASVLESYGPDVKEPGTFAHNCLMARRLIERGRGVSSSCTRDGISTIPSPRNSTRSARTRTARAPRSSWTSNSAACSTTRWSSGAVNSVARPSSRGSSTTVPSGGATTIRTRSRSGWPGAA
jgi:hypothetical protein